MIGQRLGGRYEIVRELGRGGMGVVYLARDPVLDREVAVKVVPGDRLSPENDARLQREARLVARLDHPGIVAVYDFARHQDSVFFVMPVARGSSLRALLREGPLGVAEAVEVAAQVAVALDYSHRFGVVHRDVKPENVMVLREAGGLRVRVMDFGVALARSETRATREGTIVGTLGYLAPEQLTNGTIDGRTDVYSLGVVLYEMLSGRAPFQGRLETLLYSIVREAPRSLREAGLDVPPELAQLVHRCLAKAPGERPQAAAEVAEALRRIAAGAAPLAPSSAAGAARLPLLGREKELAEIVRRLDRTLVGECQLVVVGGEPGMGKSRLLAEVESLAAALPARVFRGRFVERTDPAFPYQAFCEVIQEVLRAHPPGDPERPNLEDLLPDLVLLFPVLEDSGTSRGPLPTAEIRPAPETSRAAENKSAAFELVARTLARIGRGKPLVLLLEDLHAADVSLEALQYIFRRLASVPLLVVGTFNSEARDEADPLGRALRTLGNDPRFALLQLGRLAPAELRRLAREASGGREIEEPLLARIEDLGEGNPSLVIEAVRSLLDSGPREAAALAEGRVPLPSSARQLVDARLQHLSAEQRQLLATASVLGRSFDVRDLELVADAAGLEDLLEALVSRGHLEEEARTRGERLSFASRLTREVLHEGLTVRRRCALHRRYAEGLERRHGTRPERVGHLLSRHFALAGMPEKAVHYALLAARTALAASVPEDAARFARAALDALNDVETPDPLSEAEARLALADAHALAGRVDDALAAATAACAAARRAGASARLISAQLLAAETAWRDRRVEESKRWVEEGSASAREAGDGEALNRFQALAEEIADRRGPSPASEPAGPLAAYAPGDAYGDALTLDRLARAEYLGVEESYREAARQAGVLAPEAEARYVLRLAALSQQLGDYREALDWCRQVVERLDDQQAELAARLQARTVGLCLRLGKTAEAEVAGERAQAGLERALAGGEVPAQTRREVLSAVGSLAVVRGDCARALAAAEEVVALSEDAGARGSSRLLLAQARALAGDHAGATAASDDALADRSADHDVLAGAGLLRTELLTSEGEADRALELARASLPSAVEARDPWLTGRVRLALARAELAVGLVEDAEEEFLRVVRDATPLEAAPLLLAAQLGLASVARLRGRLLAAEVAARIAVELCSSVRSPAATVACLVELTRVLAAAGQHEERRQQLAAARAAAEGEHNPYLLWPLAEETLAEAVARRDAEAVDAALAEVRAHAGQDLAPAHRSRALGTVAEARIALDAPGPAREAARDALREALVASSAPAAARAYGLLSAAALAEGDTASALRLAQARVEALAEPGPGVGRLRAAAHLGVAAVETRRGDRAAVKVALGAALREVAAGASAAAKAEGRLAAGAVLGRTDPDQARALLGEACSQAAVADCPFCEARSLGLLGELAIGAGRLSEAVELLRAERSVRELSGAVGALLANRVRLAWAYQTFGDSREAAALLSSLEPGPPEPWLARALVLRGRVHRERACFGEAWSDLERAVSLAGTLGLPAESVLVRRERAEHLLSHGDLPGAATEIERGRAACAPGWTPSETALVELSRDGLDVTEGRAALLSHRPQLARELARRALQSFGRGRAVAAELEARLLAIEATLVLGEDASAELDAVLEETQNLGLVALQVDALVLAARARRVSSLAAEAHRLAGEIGSHVRQAVASRLEANLEARVGHAAEAVQATTRAARALAQVRDALPASARTGALLFWESRARPLG